MDEALHTSLKGRQTDLREEPPAPGTAGWERRRPAGWRSSGLHPAPPCWTCQSRPRTGLGRRKARHDTSPPAAWSRPPAERVGEKGALCHPDVVSAVWRRLGVYTRVCAGQREAVCVCVFVCVRVFLHCMSITHLSPVFRDHVLQSLDNENTEVAWCAGLHLINSNSRGSKTHRCILLLFSNVILKTCTFVTCSLFAVPEGPPCPNDWSSSAACQRSHRVRWLCRPLLVSAGKDVLRMDVDRMHWYFLWFIFLVKLNEEY